ncbi:MAG TPA: MFS transporter [Thermoleophilia bacterium]|nr:MFS transporter [Thermoleophilia bacterium]
MPEQNLGRKPAFLTRMFRSLRTRNYRLWFFGQTVSQSGTWMQSVAQYWLVLELTHSAFDLGITAALQFAPVLLFGTIGGLVADRFDKRRVLLVTQTAFAVQAAVLWILVASGSVQLWMVWALALLYGFINVLDNPSRQSFVMEMAGPDDLANAIALNSVIVNVSRIIGPALAGVAIATIGLSWAFLANAISFFAVIGALYAMRPADLHRRPPVARAKGQIRAGLRYAWGAWELRVPLLMMAVIGTLGYNFSVILPLYAHDVFHRGAGTYSALTVAMGVGALAGGLFVASRRRPSYRLLVVVSLAFGVFILGVAVAPTLPFVLVLLALMGAASLMFIAVANSLLQLNSSGAMRGRVMSLWAVVFLGSTPIGAPLIGFIAGQYGARFALGIGGVATVLVAVWAGFALRHIRNDRRLAVADAAATAAAAASVAVAERLEIEGHLREGGLRRPLEPAGENQPA